MYHAPVFTTTRGGIRLLRTKQLPGLTALARPIRFLFTSSSPKAPSRSRFSICSKRDGNSTKPSSVRKTSQLQLDPEILEGSSSSDQGLKKSPLQLLHLFFDRILRRVNKCARNQFLATFAEGEAEALGGGISQPLLGLHEIKRENGIFSSSLKRCFLHAEVFEVASEKESPKRAESVSVLGL